MAENPLLTNKELILIRDIGDIIARVSELEDGYPVWIDQDIRDTVFHVNSLQRIIMMRAAVRSNPGAFPRDGFEVSSLYQLKDTDKERET